MALERLQTEATSRVPSPDCAVPRRCRKLGRIMQEDHRVDCTVVTIECLQAEATADLPDLDSVVFRR
jgi:hypothetical protein